MKLTTLLAWHYWETIGSLYVICLCWQPTYLASKIERFLPPPTLYQKIISIFWCVVHLFVYASSVIVASP